MERHGFKAPDWYASLYFTILTTHTILAVVIVPLIAITFYRAFRLDFARHRKIARLTLPLWLVCVSHRRNRLPYALSNLSWRYAVMSEDSKPLEVTSSSWDQSCAGVWADSDIGGAICGGYFSRMVFHLVWSRPVGFRHYQLPR